MNTKTEPAGGPMTEKVREILARAISLIKWECLNDSAQEELKRDADRVLAALKEAGYYVCKRVDMGSVSVFTPASQQGEE